MTVAVVCMGLGMCFGVTAILIWQLVELKLANRQIIAEAQKALKAASEYNQAVMSDLENIKIKLESLEFWKLQGQKK